MHTPKPKRGGAPKPTAFCSRVDRREGCGFKHTPPRIRRPRPPRGPATPARACDAREGLRGPARACEGVGLQRPPRGPRGLGGVMSLSHHSLGSLMSQPMVICLANYPDLTQKVGQIQQRSDDPAGAPDDPGAPANCRREAARGREVVRNPHHPRRLRRSTAKCAQFAPKRREVPCRPFEPCTTSRRTWPFSPTAKGYNRSLNLRDCYTP